MAVFDTNTIAVTSGVLNGELFVDEQPENDFVNLLWVIELGLEPLVIYDKKYTNVNLYLGTFTLPYTSYEALSNTVKTVSDWYELEGQEFRFINAEHDNICQIYYEGIHTYKNDDGETVDAEEWYDNTVVIDRVKFGKIVNHSIEFEATIRIKFDHFNVHYPPFYETGLICPSFKISSLLKLGRIRFLNGAYDVKSESQAKYLASYSINIDSHTLKLEAHMVRLNHAEQAEKKFYYFYFGSLSNE